MYTAKLRSGQIRSLLQQQTLLVTLNLIISACYNDMEILAFQNCKIRNVFSYYGIIADDLVLCFPNYNDIIKEFTA